MDEETAKAAAEFFGPDGRHNEDYLFQNTIETRFKQKSRIIDTGVDSYLVPWDDGAG